MIQIADRFRPFSHTPGQVCMIPRSNWAVEAFPTQFRFFEGNHEIFINFELTGPVEGFTIEQDLEKDVVRIFGRAKQTYFNFEIDHQGDLISLTLKRGEPIAYQFGDERGVIQKGQSLQIASELAFSLIQEERLSLGMNKKLDWDAVLRRDDLREILPVLFLLGQKTPCSDEFALEDLSYFVKSHFSHILVPRKICDKRLGLGVSELSEDLSFAAILYNSYRAIRSLFIAESGGEVHLLPHLPKEFVFGRALRLKTSAAFFDIEWSKRRLFKVQITPFHSGALRIKWPKEIDSFRLRNHVAEKGEMVGASELIVLSSGQTIYLDKFQK